MASAQGVFADPNFAATHALGEERGVHWCKARRGEGDWTWKERQERRQLLTEMQREYLCYMSVVDESIFEHLELSNSPRRENYQVQLYLRLDL